MPRRKSPEDLSPEQAQEQAQASALRLLGVREHSVAQLKRKLALRGHGGERADTVIENLSAAGWQSDSRYAETLARSRAHQGYGPMRIRADLQAAGIKDAEARAALEALEWDFIDAARRTHARHFREPPAVAAEWQKHYRYLAGRGFEPAQIRAVLKAPRDVDDPEA